MGICKDKAEQLEKTCKEQGEKIKELKAKLEDRNSKITELESELYVKEGLLNIKSGPNTDGLNDRKKEFNEICDTLSDYMKDYNKDGVIRFLAELTQKLRESGVMYTVEALDGEISVRDVFIRNQNGVTVDINGIPKKYSYEKISEIVRAYEDVQYCKEHAGEHLHSEEHLKIISLRGENDSLKRKVKELHSKLDESIEAERSLCEEIEKLEAEKRENRDKVFPYESIEQMKERIEKLNDRHQSDCIEKTQLHTALDVMTEKYQRLRDVHGL